MFINGTSEEMDSSTQQYCLRWNNHQSNLLMVFDHQFRNGQFCDVTIAVDGTSIKAHKTVLAACSSYFEHLFSTNECSHPIVILKDILQLEMRAILDYMYRGEVNVAQGHLAGLLRAAETLKVKGLVEDNQNVGGGNPTRTPPTRSPYPPAQPSSSTPEFQSAPATPINYYSKINSSSAPHHKFISSDYETPSPYSASNYSEKSHIPFISSWPTKVPSPPSPKHALSNNNNSNNYENDMVLSKKKKYMETNRDTPILRNVLGHTSFPHHNSIDSQPHINYQHQPQANQQPQSVKTHHMPIATNGPIEHNDKMRPETPDHSSGRSVDGDKVSRKQRKPTKSRRSHSRDSMESENKIGLVSHPPGQKPSEWKRYKQYTRSDIMSAIDAVRAGTSALQAARTFNVPSRTLYDKVKKLGISTNRLYRKGSFPMSPYQGLNMKSEDTSSYSPEDNTMAMGNSTTGNGMSGLGGNGMEIDSDHLSRDKLDSDPGCSLSVKQELIHHSPPIDHKEDLNHHILHEEHIEINGSEVCSSTSPRDREPSEPEETRSASE